MSIKILTVFGTRPEAAKMVPLVAVLRDCPYTKIKVAVTAQHRAQLDQVLNVFNIKPDYDLDIMQPRQTLADITIRALKGVEETIAKDKPDLVLVHGDTTTTLAASLAAYYAQVKLGHVEAGLRTYDKFQPFPEELNRRITSALADLHFAPTENAKLNLIKENISAHNIYVTGNTAIDCLASTVKAEHRFELDVLNNIDFSKRVIAMTAHRRENLGQPLAEICRAVRRLADSFQDIIIVYAVHLNPAVRETVFPVLSNHPRIHLIDPLNILDMHNLMSRSFFILTDSGGLQEEAPAMGKPVLVLRNVTERPEAVSAGTVDVIGTERENVFAASAQLLTDRDKYLKMASAKNPYGDGHASERIRDAILGAFNR
ncbi:MAG: UDP-N-acetylglucosamine 2-epimerase (non-hydrolyzing) [Clostridiales bacterium]|nr:UDP-N-acetylglucosamine 2-epimerase (non-hydrolyzing) [Clostridiales bacterium]